MESVPVELILEQASANQNACASWNVGDVLGRWESRFCEKMTTKEKDIAWRKRSREPAEEAGVENG